MKRADQHGIRATPAEVAELAEPEIQVIDAADVPPQRDPTKEEKLRAEALTIQHLCTHKPQNPFCAVCNESKLKVESAFRKDPETRHVEKDFAALVHMDHSTRQHAVEAGLEGELRALHIRDHATKLRGMYPAPSKSTYECKKAIRHFLCLLYTSDAADE